MKYVNQRVPKIDAKTLTLGKPVYTNDLAPGQCLVIKLLRSPHAHALIEEIKVAKAQQAPGVACVLTYKDVPQNRFTIAGQSYPEPSPYDRLIMDQKVRFVGDVVAVVAAESEAQANYALKLIKVKYRSLPAILDPKEAEEKAEEVIIHDEEGYHLNVNIANERFRNICSQESFAHGDLQTQWDQSACLIEETYETQACQQTMMEPFAAYCMFDYQERLQVVASTQIPFHVRRILSRALNLSPSKIRVLKPRIGGGFGAKQTVVAELYPALVTLKTGRPSKIVFDRKESFVGGNPRHPMIIDVKVGSDEAGNLTGLHVRTLSNTGAYGEHGCTTVGLSGHKTIPLYGRLKASAFDAKVVYTNLTPAGAYRGYGATQGCFAVESAINELAHQLKMDPIELRLKNLVQTGEVMPAYYGEVLGSSRLKECIAKGKAMIGWEDKYPRRVLKDGTIRGVGMAITMQGSGIAGLDTAKARITLNDQGLFTLAIGAADMGTGCDTILTQMAAETLSCEMDKVVVAGVDTDHSPFDKGSYASSTTYVTGMAVIKACQILLDKMKEYAADLLQVQTDTVAFDGSTFSTTEGSQKITLNELATQSALGIGKVLQGEATHGSPVSPPPFVAGFAEVEVDPMTGKVSLIQMVAVVDCGTIINKNLARVQTEGGLVQGIGMALFEEARYTEKGKLRFDSLMQYKIPARTEVGEIRVDFVESYEATGPFGAKSIGEVVINTPAPAIADAIFQAVGVRLRQLPMTPEKVYMAMQGQKELGQA